MILEQNHCVLVTQSVTRTSLYIHEKCKKNEKKYDIIGEYNCNLQHYINKWKTPLQYF
jgi:hypothetical protein